jgi:hypothetical protein
MSAPSYGINDSNVDEQYIESRLLSNALSRYLGLYPNPR